jgi:hypothetical protein
VLSSTISFSFSILFVTSTSIVSRELDVKTTKKREEMKGEDLAVLCKINSQTHK